MCFKFELKKVCSAHSALSNLLFMCYLQGERTLSLLVENCGRVNYGITLDEQRKGTLPHRWLKQ
jgi:hypothetical protein